MDKRAGTSTAVRSSLKRSATTTAAKPQPRAADGLRYKTSTSSKPQATPPVPPKATVTRSNTNPNYGHAGSSNNQVHILLPPNMKVSHSTNNPNVVITTSKNTLSKPQPAKPPAATVKRSNTTPTQRVDGWTPLTAATAPARNIQPQSHNTVTLTRAAAPVKAPRAPEPTFNRAAQLNRSKSESNKANADETAPMYDVFKSLKKPMVLPTALAGTKKNAIIAANANTAIIDSGLPGNKSGHVVKVVESGGVCLQAAQMALYGRHLPPSQRITWHRTTEQDKRMEMLLDWIERTRWGLASLAFHKFLASRSRGALIFNVHGRLATSPQEPAVDWITFEEAQKTLDTQLQEYIATYDPEVHALVFAFRLSPNEQSMKIWGKKIGVPPQLPKTYTDDVDAIKRELRKKKLNVITEDPSPLKPASLMKWFKSKK